MMERASPAELRKAIELANFFVKNGIGFVPVPIFSDGQKQELVNMALLNLEIIEKNCGDYSTAPSPDQHGKSNDL